jgi:ubiquinone biosynthesis protein
MNGTDPQRLRRSEAERQRKREIESCLARWGLLRRPRPLALSGGGGEPGAAALGSRLRSALQELGPAFAGFGAYLATRVDLLVVTDCLELAAISDRAAPLAAAEVRERIAAELGRTADDVFLELAAEPFESRLFVQSHRGRLASGAPVIVRLVRTDAGGSLELDLELLPVVTRALAGQGWVPAAIEGAVEDFRQSLGHRTDLRTAAQSLDLLAADAAAFGRLAAPPVHAGLTTPRLLVHGDLGGISAAAAAEPVVLPLRGAAWDRGDAARQLCTVWLRQALLGGLFPVELQPEDARILPGDQIGFQGTALVRTRATVRADLRDLLLAVAAREPDEACAVLLRQVIREDGAASEEQLRLHLRQIIPFRDGAWSASGETLAEHLFVYLRTAHSRGYRPRHHLLAFCRGLFAVATAARRLAPERDAVLEGLQELRVLASMSQARDAMRPEQWSGQLDQYAALMAALPQKLDELLTLAAEGGSRAESAEPPPAPRRAERSHLLLAAWLLVLAAMALLLQHLVKTDVLAGRGEAIAAFLFLAFGGILLWALGRTR